MNRKKRVSKNKLIPSNLQDHNNWKLSRRKFVENIMVGGVATTLPSLSVFGNDNNHSNSLSNKQFYIITSVQNILYPSDGNGPGAYDVMADRYLDWVLSDKMVDPEEKNYILAGIGWVDETAFETFSEPYNSLSQLQKEELITIISNEKWGKSWLGVMLNFIFEALLSDPKYGGNNDEIGWDWLEHNPGFPRPTKQLLYPEITITIAKNIQ